MPIQHADAILKRMGRRDKSTVKRNRFPSSKRDSGYCSANHADRRLSGEAQEQHEELMEFVDEMEFERLSVFAYSPEENTPAASMPDQIRRK